jgi:hypothetical protein
MEHEATFKLTRQDLITAVWRYWSAYHLRMREIVATLIFIFFIVFLALYRKDPGIIAFGVILFVVWAAKAVNYLRTREAALKLFATDEMAYKLFVSNQGLAISRADGSTGVIYQSSRIARISKYSDMWLVEEGRGKYVPIPLKGIPIDVLQSVDRLCG